MFLALCRKNKKCRNVKSKWNVSAKKQMLIKSKGRYYEKTMKLYVTAPTLQKDKSSKP